MSLTNSFLVCALVLHGLSSAASGQTVRPTDIRTFSSTPACSACVVEFRHQVTLTLPADSIYVDGSTNIFRLRDGSFLLTRLGGSRSPGIIDATGRFRRLIARVGNGPGEISSTTLPVARTRGDSIWIIDGVRKLVFSPGAIYVREERLLNRGGTDLVVAHDGTVITADVIGTRNAPGYPLHVRNADFSLRRSFGVLDPAADQRRLAATGDDFRIYLHRRLSPADSASFWAYNESRFLLERYDMTGGVIERFQHALDGWFGASTRLKPSPGEYNGLALHGVLQSVNPDIIWLVYHAPRPGYVSPQPGTNSDWQKWTASHDVVVEALDTRRNEVVATGRVPQTQAFTIRYAPDMLALMRPVDDQVLSVRVVALQINRSQR